MGGMWGSWSIRVPERGDKRLAKVGPSSTCHPEGPGSQTSVGAPGLDQVCQVKSKYPALSLDGLKTLLRKWESALNR